LSVLIYNYKGEKLIDIELYISLSFVMKAGNRSDNPVNLA